MRVIGGKYRSRVLKSPPGRKVRPTPDRLRETLFNVLAPEIEGAIFLDAYAGSGSVGIEALSRGAKHTLFFERSADALVVLKGNLDALQIPKREATVIRGNAAGLLAKHTADVVFDIVFIDPPYEQARDYEAALETLGGAACGLAVFQHDTHREMPEESGKLRRVRQLRQGSNVLTFYRTA